MKYFIVTFGCAANEADSERIRASFEARGYMLSSTWQAADEVVINTCMIRQKAEDRVYGLVHNISKYQTKRKKKKVIVTGCMVGMAIRDKTGKLLKYLRGRMPEVTSFLPIEEVGFDYVPVRSVKSHALVPITNGCNNFCTFCVVPFTRGREVSRPYAEIIAECQALSDQGYSSVTLIGQNVNSYGADLIVGEKNVQVMRDIGKKGYFGVSNKHEDAYKKTYTYNGKEIQPTYVKHLGRLRIPTLFPQLLTEICKIDGLTRIDFISSNPWDFSDDLIGVLTREKKISRTIHLPVQSGDNQMLKKMNRWYTREEYLALVDKLKKTIKNVQISTDIIVGFCGETEEQFNNTLDLCKKVGFLKAYVAMYSDRPMTAAHKVYTDDVPHKEKKRRWKILEDYINIPNLHKFHETH